MRVCVAGAGAMGSLFGGHLARVGHEVTLLDAWPEHVERIKRDGLRVEGVSGTFTVQVPASTRAADLPPADLALVYVPSHATAAVGAVLPGLLAGDGVAVTLQNGIGNVEVLAGAVGPHRVLAGVTHHSAEVLGPGRVRHTHAGPVWIGSPDGRRPPRLEELARALRASGHDVHVVEDVTAHIWAKFVLNCAINALSAVTGLRLGEMARTPAVDEYQERLLDEIFAVVRAKKLDLPDPDLRRYIKRHTWSKFSRPSMLQHVQAGKATEIDALNGALVAEAEALGLAVPYNRALVLLTKGVERGHAIRVHEPHTDYGRLEAAARSEPEPPGRRTGATGP